MFDVECPYCGKEQDIDHDDGYGYVEDEIYNQECPHCEKYFIYTTYISFSYHTKKADCLNDVIPHDYTPTGIYNDKFIKIRCNLCSDETWIPKES